MNISSLVLTLVASLLVTFGALIGDRSMAWVELPRRWIWLAAMAASVFIPFMGPWLPSFELGLTVRDAIGTVDDVDAGHALSIGITPLNLGPLWLLVTGWTTLSFLTLGIMLGSYRRVLRKVEEGASTVIDGREVIVCRDAGPFVLGLINPKLVVPQWTLQVPRAERNLIFEHELQHVSARDGLALAFGSLLLVAMPWNPFLWLQHSRLRLAIEIDCDRRVLGKGVSRSSYGRALLRAAGGMRGQSWFVPAWGAPSSHLRARIISMTQPSAPYGKFFAVPGGLLAALLLMAACDVGSPDNAPELAIDPPAQASSALAPSVEPETETTETVVAPEAPVAVVAASGAQAPGDPVRSALRLREAVSVSLGKDSIDGQLVRLIAEDQPTFSFEKDSIDGQLRRWITEDQRTR